MEDPGTLYSGNSDLIVIIFCQSTNSHPYDVVTLSIFVIFDFSASVL